MLTFGPEHEDYRQVIFFMTKHFNYWLTGIGWAEAFISSDKQNVRFEISYLRDPLTDLYAGICRLVDNQSDTEKVIFAEEPGEHSLVITKQDHDTIKIEIYWSGEWEDLVNPNKSPIKKELVYSDTDTLTNFVSVICIGTDSLLERMTLDQYKEKWSLSEFPIENYRKLRQLLD